MVIMRIVMPIEINDKIIIRYFGGHINKLVVFIGYVLHRNSQSLFSIAE